MTSDDALQSESVTRAAIAHHDFEALHPFIHGNGRAGRLLLNLMLLQDGYPLALVLRGWHARSMHALHAAYFGEYLPLTDFIGLAVERALDLSLVASTESTVHLLPLHELAHKCSVGVDYLGQFPRKGKIEVTKRGQYWYTTRTAVQDYLTEAEFQLLGLLRIGDQRRYVCLVDDSIRER